MTHEDVDTNFDMLSDREADQSADKKTRQGSTLMWLGPK